MAEGFVTQTGGSRVRFGGGIGGGLGGNGQGGDAALGAGLGWDMHVSDSRLAPGRDEFGVGGRESDETAEIPHPAIGAARFRDAARNRDADCSVRVGMAASGGMLLDAEARRRGETRGEHVRIGFSPWNAAQESQNRRARSQRRSYGFAARLTLGWKAPDAARNRRPQSP